jgi:hypothetical protein
MVSSLMVQNDKSACWIVNGMFQDKGLLVYMSQLEWWNYGRLALTINQSSMDCGRIDA